MKVRVSHLPPEGLPVKGELSLENLNNRMNEGRDHGIRFVSAPQVDLLVTKTPQGAETRGVVSARYTQPCGRCDEVVERTVEVEANWVLHRKPEAVRPTSKRAAEKDTSTESPQKKSNPRHARIEDHPEDFEDDVGISFFEGDQVDLESLLQELLILQLEPFWHPVCDTAGACSYCQKVVEPPAGKDTQDAPALERISLGDLLKKAGVSNN